MILEAGVEGWAQYTARTSMITNSRHRFWSDKSSKEDLVFHGWADPQGGKLTHILDENFLRNLQGYMADCQKINLEPSILQLALFSYEASTLGTPPFWMPLRLVTMVNYILARWIAAGLLGYVPLSRILPSYIH